MQEAKLSNGCNIPLIGLGTWKSGPGEAKASIKEAIKCGYRHIDCAFFYGNQEEIGQALQECFKEGLCAREDLFITSKLWNDSHDPDHVVDALKVTLKELRLDYLDMWLIHWPIAQKQGVGLPESADDFISLEDLPISKTWQGLEKCVDAGLTRGIGVSNFSVKKLRDLLETARIPPAVNQVERHPYLAQPALMDFCKNKIHVTGYSPLGSMDRPDRLRKESDPVLLEDPVILEIAKKHGVSPAQVLLKWAILTNASAIPKSVSPRRIAENFASLQVNLDEEDMKSLQKLDKHRRYVDGSIWVKEQGPYTIANIWDE